MVPIFLLNTDSIYIFLKLICYTVAVTTIPRWEGLILWTTSWLVTGTVIIKIRFQQAVPPTLPHIPVHIYTFILTIFFRVPYRIKKWWFPFYSWSLSVCAVNAWRLRRRVTGHNEPYLDFLRELCLEMFATHGTPPSVKRASLTAAGDGARFDRMDHWITNTEEDASGKHKRRNCKQCALSNKKDMKTTFMCEKCEMPLHTFCFKERILFFIEQYIFGLFFWGFWLFLGKYVPVPYHFCSFSNILLFISKFLLYCSYNELNPQKYHTK